MQPFIELDELTVPFGDPEVLKNLHIALFGRIIGLSEPNGTGKSTLIHALPGFCPASASAILSKQRIRILRRSGHHNSKISHRKRPYCCGVMV